MLELTQGLFGAADPEYLGDFSDPLSSWSTAIGKFGDYFDELTADRRAHPTDDLATVHRQRPGGRRPDRRASSGSGTTSSWRPPGHDTTSFALSGGLEQLLRHPDQLPCAAGRSGAASPTRPRR